MYNTILRRFPEDAWNVVLKGKNFYSTVIYVLVSAIQKLSRSVKIQDGLMLYRGLGGVIDLPKTMNKSNEVGSRGFAEWGFMSTTTKRSVALQYSGVKECRPKAMMLSIRTGAIDRAACLHEYSQYPQEQEYLWLPLSYLQPDGEPFEEVTDDGVVSTVPLRVIPNLKTSTLDDAEQKQVQIHVKGFEGLLEQLKVDLNRKVDGAFLCGASKISGMDTIDFSAEKEKLIAGIIKKGYRVLEEHKKISPDTYSCFDEFKRCNEEMLNTHIQGIAMMDLWLRFLTDPTWAEFSRFEFSPIKTSSGPATLTSSQLGSSPGSTLSRTDIRKFSKSLNFILTLSISSHTCTRLVVVLETSNRQKKSPLSVASDLSFDDCIEILHKAGDDINHYDESRGQTPLLIATSNGNLSSVKALLQSQADVNRRNRDGHAPIHIAALRGYEKCIQALVEAKAEAATRHYGTDFAPIHMVSQQGHASCISALAKLGQFGGRFGRLF